MNYNKAEFKASYGSFARLPAPERPEFAFSGRSNVGKSSLINKLLNRKALARVSSVPGKTVTINFYAVDDIYIVDLPGYGYAKVAKSEKERWAGLVEGYLRDRDSLALVFQLIDFRHPPTADDRLMIEFLVESELPFVVVLTKADKLKKSERVIRRKALLSELPYADEITMIEFSAETGEGRDELRAIIEEIAEEEEAPTNTSPLEG
ncbi:MAG: ribosome biogenesis GTP-binding protein YihA/YsxC [Bacteroides sp.]|nr:ribosome biogenesis GTP-binding protein YihA/YsxC [Eubacterium sp.]MCM1418659.1 ribosome biogenesis GTP-binding protein YihA/YsxC [Roseburia sp.]MCM1462713.1 ribosome biogenesis GTP-binding protein YihA/YsxC [Bacteroides sp.]